MNTYEAMFILQPVGTEEEQKQLTGEMDDLIRKIQGTVDRNQYIGRRKLAYEINHRKEGYYYLARFKAPSVAIKDLERSLQLHERVIRFMVVTAENAPLEELTLASETAEASSERDS